MDFATGFDYAYGDGYYGDDVDTNDYYDAYADYYTDSGDMSALPAVIDNAPYDYFVVHESNALQLLNYQDPLIHSHEYHSGLFRLDANCPECNEIINEIESGNNQWGRELVHVNPYFRDGGTFVEGHFRTAPDGIEANNFSK